MRCRDQASRLRVSAVCGRTLGKCDVAHPARRTRAVGVCRLWRDGGFAIGALLCGALAGAYGLTTVIRAVAALTAATGLLVAVRMYATHPHACALTGLGTARTLPTMSITAIRVEDHRGQGLQPDPGCQDVRGATRPDS